MDPRRKTAKPRGLLDPQLTRLQELGQPGADNICPAACVHVSEPSGHAGHTGQRPAAQHGQDYHFLHPAALQQPGSRDAASTSVPHCHADEENEAADRHAYPVPAPNNLHRLVHRHEGPFEEAYTAQSPVDAHALTSTIGTGTTNSAAQTSCASQPGGNWQSASSTPRCLGSKRLLLTHSQVCSPRAAEESLQPAYSRGSSDLDEWAHASQQHGNNLSGQHASLSSHADTARCNTRHPPSPQQEDREFKGAAGGKQDALLRSQLMTYTYGVLRWCLLAGILLLCATYAGAGSLHRVSEADSLSMINK